MPHHPRPSVVGDEVPVCDAPAVPLRDGHEPPRARTGEAARAPLTAGGPARAGREEIP